MTGHDRQTQSFTVKDTQLRAQTRPLLGPVPLCHTEGDLRDAELLLVTIPPSCSSQWRCVLAVFPSSQWTSICWLNDIGPHWAGAAGPGSGFMRGNLPPSPQATVWAGLTLNLGQWQQKGVVLCSPLHPRSGGGGEKTHHNSVSG